MGQLFCSDPLGVFWQFIDWQWGIFGLWIQRDAIQCQGWLKWCFLLVGLEQD